MDEMLCQWTVTLLFVNSWSTETQKVDIN